MATIQSIMAEAGKIPIAKIGGVDDHLEIESDGSYFLRGNSTMWDDLVGSLVARRLESTSGRLQYNYSENSIVMQDNGSISSNTDRLIFNHQKPHGAKTASSFHLHIHWEQTEVAAIEFTLQYRIQENGAAKETTWTEVVVSSGDGNKFPYTSGTLNQITELIELDWSGAGISATVQFRLARTDDVGLNDIDATFVDGHVERDNIGSRQEYIK